MCISYLSLKKSLLNEEIHPFLYLYISCTISFQCLLVNRCPSTYDNKTGLQINNLVTGYRSTLTICGPYKRLQSNLFDIQLYVLISNQYLRTYRHMTQVMFHVYMSCLATSSYPYNRLVIIIWWCSIIRDYKAISLIYSMIMNPPAITNWLVHIRFQQRILGGGAAVITIYCLI